MRKLQLNASKALKMLRSSLAGAKRGCRESVQSGAEYASRRRKDPCPDIGRTQDKVMCKAKSALLVVEYLLVGI